MKVKTLYDGSSPVHNGTKSEFRKAGETRAVFEGEVLVGPAGGRGD